jgi:hypothetical protein
MKSGIRTRVKAAISAIRRREKERLVRSNRVKEAKQVNFLRKKLAQALNSIRLNPSHEAYFDTISIVRRYLRSLVQNKRLAKQRGNERDTKEFDAKIGEINQLLNNLRKVQDAFGLRDLLADIREQKRDEQRRRKR